MCSIHGYVHYRVTRFTWRYAVPGVHSHQVYRCTWRYAIESYELVKSSPSIRMLEKTSNLIGERQALGANDKIGEYFELGTETKLNDISAHLLGD